MKLLHASIAAIVLASVNTFYEGEPEPNSRSNRHGKRHTPEPTQFTTSHNKSDKLKRLLRK